MKHFVVVLSIIVFVSFVFLHPSIIEDASFNDFEYLQKMRRTHDTVNTDDKSKGWQDNGIFNPWYQPGTGSENDKALNNLNTVPSVSVSTSETETKNDSTPTPSSTPNEPTKNDDDNQKHQDDKTKNLLFLLLIIFVILCVIAIVYSLNNTNNFRRNYNGSKP